MIEILGWVATSAVLLSFLFKDMFKLRIANSTGAMLWLIYAYLKSDYPLIAVNAAILFVHGYWFVSNFRSWKN